MDYVDQRTRNMETEAGALAFLKHGMDGQTRAELTTLLLARGQLLVNAFIDEKDLSRLPVIQGQMKTVDSILSWINAPG
jgi:hypothetical protein